MEIGKGNTAFVSMISIVSAFRSKEGKNDFQAVEIVDYH